MIMWAINKTMEAAMKTAWKPVRSFYDGASGTKKFLNEAGEQVKLNPAQKLVQRLKNDARQIGSGKRRDLKGNIIDEDLSAFDRHVTNRIGGALHLVGDATVGTLATGLGWGARTIGGGALAMGAMAFRPTMKGVGHVTKQSIDLVGDTALGAADLVHQMNKSTTGRNLLFGAGFAGVAGTSAFNSNMLSPENYRGGESAIKLAMKNMYDGEKLDALPGTIGDTQVVQRNPLDNMGADGDLVFAMHNMR